MLAASVFRTDNTRPLFIRYLSPTVERSRLSFGACIGNPPFHGPHSHPEPVARAKAKTGLPPPRNLCVFSCIFFLFQCCSALDQGCERRGSTFRGKNSVIAQQHNNTTKKNSHYIALVVPVLHSPTYAEVLLSASTCSQNHFRSMSIPCVVSHKSPVPAHSAELESVLHHAGQRFLIWPK